MENSTKKHLSVEVCGIALNIVTDETKEFLEKTAQNLSEQINMITSANFCVTKLDAAILCALDSLGEMTKASEKIRELEARLSVLEIEADSLRAEKDSLKDSIAPSKPGDYSSNQEKIKSLENFLNNKING